MFDTLKGALKSLTIAFNVFIVAAIPMLDYAQTQLPELKAMMPDGLYNYAFMAVVVSNILLRFKTTKALSDK